MSNTLTNKYGLPETLVNLAKRDTYTRGDARISVTELIGSPRIRIMKRRHHDQIVTDVSDMVWSLIGRALHYVVEQGAGSAHITEERLFWSVNDWKISGGVDLQVVLSDGSVEVSDWKMTSAYAVMNGKDDWEKQTNSYAFLIEKAKGVTVTSLNIIAVVRDWSRHEAARNPNYPQAPVVVLPQRLWSSEERDAYITKRVMLHQDAERRVEWQEDPPECSDEDRWFRPGKISIVKDGRVRALKLFEADDMEAAKAYADENKARVEVRPGQNVRCETFCPVSQWCEQWAKIKETGNE